MNYIDEKIKEIIKTNGNEEKIKEILCHLYASIQMDSNIRNNFEITLNEMYSKGNN